MTTSVIDQVLIDANCFRIGIQQQPLTTSDVVQNLNEEYSRLIWGRPPSEGFIADVEKYLLEDTIDDALFHAIVNDDYASFLDGFFEFMITDD